MDMKKKEKTDMIIKDGLIELMHENKFENITMTQLAKALNLNRITLYRHFDDKFEIIEQIENSIISELEESLSDVYSLNFENFMQLRNDRLNKLLKVFKKNQTSICILLGRNGDSSFHYKLLKFFEQSEGKGQQLLKEKNELFAIYQINAILGVIEYWIKTPEMSIDDIHKFLINMTNKLLK